MILLYDILLCSSTILEDSLISIKLWGVKWCEGCRGPLNDHIYRFKLLWSLVFGDHWDPIRSWGFLVFHEHCTHYNFHSHYLSYIVPIGLNWTLGADFSFTLSFWFYSFCFLVYILVCVFGLSLGIFMYYIFWMGTSV